MKRSWHILFLVFLFLGAASVLDGFHFWESVGLPPPHGYVEQGLLFLFFYFVLKNALFDPYIAVMEHREAETFGKRTKLEQTQEKADALIAKYTLAIEEARLKALKERERILSAVEADIRLQLESSRQQAHQTLAAAKLQIQRESNEVREHLTEESVALASDVVHKILKSNNAPGKVARAQAS